MKKTTLAVLATLTMSLGAAGAAVTDRPNVVIIYGDDVGYGDVGVYGSTMIPTPNIDRLAGQGLLFTDGHASSGTCTPSRFSLLTGVHGFRRGVRILPPNAPLCISTKAFTLPKLFKLAGYHTAIIGKWHLGIGAKGKQVDWNGEVKPGPLEVGFDYSFLLPSTNDRVPCVYLRDHRVVNLDPEDPLFVGPKTPPDPRSTVYPDGRTNREAMTYYKSSHGHDDSVINGIGRIGYMSGGKSALWNDETMADEFIKEARDYIAAHRDQPFFLYFASQDIHVPRAPHPRFRGKTELTYRGDAMVQFDWSVGEILKLLDENGLTANTIVILTSDNGPVYDDGYRDGTTVKGSSKEVDRGHDGSGPFRGGKYQVYEGGTRVPFIVKWPGHIEPGTSDALVNQIDFIASFAALLGVELPEDAALDSRNTIDALLGRDKEGLPYMIEEARGRALRRGQWKYVLAQRGKSGAKGLRPGELYNLEQDPGERTDLAADHPDLAESMDAQLRELLQARGLRE